MDFWKNFWHWRDFYRRIKSVRIFCLFRCFVFLKKGKNIYVYIYRGGGYFRAEEMRVSRILACYQASAVFRFAVWAQLSSPSSGYKIWFHSRLSLLLPWNLCGMSGEGRGEEKEIVVSRWTRGRALPRYVTNDSFETHLKKKKKVVECVNTVKRVCRIIR